MYILSDFLFHLDKYIPENISKKKKKGYSLSQIIIKNGS